MDSNDFATGLMDRFDIVTILMAGVIATTWLMAIRWFLEKLGVVRYGTGRIVGSFLIPWEAKNSTYDYAMQFGIGLVFTYLYAFVYHFLTPDSVWAYVKIGTTVGVVHGFFISLFTITMGFSGRGIANGSRHFELITMPLNVGAQAIFGTLVGAAYGYAELTHSFWSFIVTALLVECILIGICMILVNHQRKARIRLSVARQF